MKKIISIFLCINLLCGCGGMKGIQRKDPTPLHKTVKTNSELYYNDLEGHDKNVKMIIRDKYHATIKIPVKYSQNIDVIPEKLPEITREKLDNLNREAKPICINCQLTERSLDIDMNYSENYGTWGVVVCPLEGVAFAFIYALVVIPLWISDGLNPISTFKEMAKIPIENCRGYKLGDIGIISIENPQGWDHLSYHKETGLSRELEEVGIEANIISEPNNLQVFCGKKYCNVVDESGEIVNEISIHREIRINKDKIKKLFKEERQKKAEQAEMRKQQKNECPILYHELLLFRQGYIDPIEQVRVGRRFNELQCHEWVHEQMYP